MDGENKGKPYFLMDDLGFFPLFFGLTPKWLFNPQVITITLREIRGLIRETFSGL